MGKNITGMKILKFGSKLSEFKTPFIFCVSLWNFFPEFLVGESMICHEKVYRFYYFSGGLFFILFYSLFVVASKRIQAHHVQAVFF